ncbi:Transmembrane protein 56-like [Balamuthia mandrillaris]
MRAEVPSEGTVDLHSIPLPFYVEDHGFWSVVPLKTLCAVFLACVTLSFLSDKACHFLFEPYKRFSRHDRIRWNLRVIALIHASIATVVGFRIFHFELPIFRDVIAGWSDSCYMMSPLTTGYMIFDLLVLCSNSKLLNDSPSILLHHLYIISGGILFWVYAPVAWGYCCSLMVTELSTIFLHFNAFFLLLDQYSLLNLQNNNNNKEISRPQQAQPFQWRKTRVYQLNGILLLLAFTHRTVISFYFSYWLWSVQGDVRRVSEGWYLFLFCGSLLLAGLNSYWYSLLCRAVLQHFAPKLLGTTWLKEEAKAKEAGGEGEREGKAAAQGEIGDNDNNNKKLL